MSNFLFGTFCENSPTSVSSFLFYFCSEITIDYGFNGFYSNLMSIPKTFESELTWYEGCFLSSLSPPIIKYCLIASVCSGVSSFESFSYTGSVGLFGSSIGLQNLYFYKLDNGISTGETWSLYKRSMFYHLGTSSPFFSTNFANSYKFITSHWLLRFLSYKS